MDRAKSIISLPVMAGAHHDEESEKDVILENLPSLTEFLATKKQSQVPTATSKRVIRASRKTIQESTNRKPSGEDTKKLPKKLNIQLTKGQQRDVKTAFSIFDTEGTGFMDSKDLRVALRALGFEPTKIEIRSLLRHVKLPKAGKLCFTDFLNVIQYKLSENDCMPAILKAFQQFDKQNQGSIDFDDLKTVVQELNVDMNDEEIAEMIAKADLSGNSMVDQEEFYRILKLIPF